MPHYTSGQTKHNLGHLDGIANLFAPIRFQGLGSSAYGQFIVSEKVGGACCPYLRGEVLPTTMPVPPQEH
jgi:hypothetical protein